MNTIVLLSVNLEWRDHSGFYFLLERAIFLKGSVYFRMICAILLIDITIDLRRWGKGG